MTTPTINYAFNLPTVGADDDIWGGLLNDNWVALDALVFGLQSRVLTAGDGLSGGGTLAADRAFAVDGTVVRTDRVLTAGVGLTGGGSLAENRTINAVVQTQATWNTGASTAESVITAAKLKGAIEALAPTPAIMPKIATWTHSTNVDEVIFTDLGDWDQIEIEVVGVTLNNSAGSSLRVSFDNGATFQTSGYASSLIDVTGGYNSSASLFLNRSATTLPAGLYRLSSMASAGSSVLNGSAVDGGGACVSAGRSPAGVVDAIRLYLTDMSRNYTGGTINIYGVRRA